MTTPIGDSSLISIDMTVTNLTNEEKLSLQHKRYQEEMEAVQKIHTSSEKNEGLKSSEAVVCEETTSQAERRNLRNIGKRL